MYWYCVYILIHSSTIYSRVCYVYVSITYCQVPLSIFLLLYPYFSLIVYFSCSKFHMNGTIVYVLFYIILLKLSLLSILVTSSFHFCGILFIFQTKLSTDIFLVIHIIGKLGFFCIPEYPEVLLGRSSTTFHKVLYYVSYFNHTRSVVVLAIQTLKSKHINHWVWYLFCMLARYLVCLECIIEGDA